MLSDTGMHVLWLLLSDEQAFLNTWIVRLYCSALNDILKQHKYICSAEWQSATFKGFMCDAVWCTMSVLFETLYVAYT